MDERDDNSGREILLPSPEQLAQARERERKLTLLRRLGHALDRPVADFFDADAGRDATPRTDGGDERG